MSITTMSADALQFEALLIARTYLYEMFRHLCGGTPNEELLKALSDATAQDVLDEYEDIEAIARLREALAAVAEMSAERSGSFLDAAKDEYTRVFIGPMSLPASPYESPYRGSHDTSLLQENTLIVRQAYREFGMEPKRLHAIPDDHIAFMCAFMAKRAEIARELYAKGSRDALCGELVAQSEFMATHMLGWLDVFAQSVATSAAAASNVLYPTALKALSAFVDADYAFVLEGAAWLSEDALPESGDEDVCSADAYEHAQRAFAATMSAYESLCQLTQVGLEDFTLRDI